MTTRMYSSNEVQVSFAGVPVDNVADGDFLTVTRTADLFTTVVGTDGNVARSPTNDNRAEITIRLMSTSPTNAAFSAIMQDDQNAPGGAGVGGFLCVDLNGTTLITAGNCWIKRPPDVTYGREANEREWMLECDNLRLFVGGNI